MRQYCRGLHDASKAAFVPNHNAPEFHSRWMKLLEGAGGGESMAAKNCTRVPPRWVKNNEVKCQVHLWAMIHMMDQALSDPQWSMAMLGKEKTEVAIQILAGLRERVETPLAIFHARPATDRKVLLCP